MDRSPHRPAGRTPCALSAQPVVETCERCGARILRGAEQPRLCGGCASPDAARNIYQIVAALHAKRGTLSDLPATRMADCALPRTAR